MKTGIQIFPHDESGGGVGDPVQPQNQEGAGEHDERRLRNKKDDGADTGQGCGHHKLPVFGKHAYELGEAEREKLGHAADEAVDSLIAHIAAYILKDHDLQVVKRRHCQTQKEQHHQKGAVLQALQQIPDASGAFGFLRGSFRSGVGNNKGGKQGKSRADDGSDHGRPVSVNFNQLSEGQHHEGITHSSHASGPSEIDHIIVDGLQHPGVQDGSHGLRHKSHTGVEDKKQRQRIKKEDGSLKDGGEGHPAEKHILIDLTLIADASQDKLSYEGSQHIRHNRIAGDGFRVSPGEGEGHRVGDEAGVHGIKSEFNKAEKKDGLFFREWFFHLGNFSLEESSFLWDFCINVFCPFILYHTFYK